MLVPRILIAGVAAALLLPAPAAAQPSREQEGAYRAARAGELRPFREIVSGVRREIGSAPLIGTEFDREAAVYRLKFMRDGSVIWVDVDGRTGQIVGRSDR